jgi:hypothetical protein
MARAKPPGRPLDGCEVLAATVGDVIDRLDSVNCLTPHPELEEAAATLHWVRRRLRELSEAMCP